MGDDPFDAQKVLIRRGVGPRQHVFGIEDVEALVLHGAHVEMAHGDDVVDVQVVLTTIAILVPLHGLLQRTHGVIALVQVLRLHVDAQVHIAT